MLSCSNIYIYIYQLPSLPACVSIELLSFGPPCNLIKLYRSSLVVVTEYNVVMHHQMPLETRWHWSNIVIIRIFVIVITIKSSAVLNRCIHMPFVVDIHDDPDFVSDLHPYDIIVLHSSLSYYMVEPLNDYLINGELALLLVRLPSPRIASSLCV